ncbi:non-ribosomal peptide synthetase, partial [Myxococcus sp. RHSTA-1-4]|uniref:non-ribosomal peptide synthetase n=1 Tax=Myxococcus sp. RHSTA-1-4 TaxID=2874601 RepID=UPI001CBC299D
LVSGSTFIHFGPEETFLQLAPISFDASTLELWGALLHGSRLVIFPPQTPSLQELARFISSHSITTLWLTAALFDQMMAQHPESLDGVRQLLAGGDVLSVARVRQRLERGGMLVNGYGPTESTTFAACYPMTSVEQVGASVSIGRPIANTQVYLLDGNGQPVPVGVRGELYIGGQGLALGYLHRPELTAERFVPNPFAAPGARMYRTGDVARWLPDGRIEFFGRADTQLKIRGFRIEPGEIEAALLQHPSVREVTVIAREDIPGDKRLVAYAVAEEGLTLDTKALRDFLQGRLPEYMVPSAFVTLEALPLSPNGKVDRRALPAPEASASREDTFVAPSSPTEQLLASIWAEVLHLTQVSAQDDFFELGGHSLLATQVISRVRDTFKVELPLRDLFEASTLTALAGRIDSAVNAGHGVQAPPMVPVSRTGTLPLSFAQQRLWFIDQLEPGNPAYNIFTALRLEGALDVSALERAFTELVGRHEALRTTFVSVNGQPTQVISAPSAFTVPVIDLSVLPEERGEAEAHQLAAQEAVRPFDLARGPLLRATLLRLDTDNHVLLLAMHHIVSDGWSMGVLVREMTALYGASTSGQTLSLPELPVQYADFASWQRGWLQGDTLATQLGWWREQLGGAPAALELPTDKPRKSVQSFRGATLPVHLSKALSSALLDVCQREGVTPFMALLATFQLLLSRYSGQDDVTVGSPIAGRNRAETEGLIGFFVNTLVLRTRVAGEQTFRELLAKVRETTLGAYAHQDVPFEKLVEELQPARDLGRTPLFQVMFTLQNAPGHDERAQSGSELRVSPLDIANTTAQFDLSLTLSQGEDGFSGFVAYATDLFEESTIRRLAGHLNALLTCAVASPDRRLRELSLLTEEERHQLDARNATGKEYPVDCLHGLFEAQAARTPDAIAVVFEDQQLTYRQLDERANRLAHHLRSLGVGPEVPVGIAVERSLELVVGLLAILKAGGAYVPMDPAYPKDRLAFMCEDTRVPVVLTQRHLRDGLPTGDTQVLCLDDASPAWAHAPSHAPRSGAQPHNLAYIIYTSGSTGRPKGAQLEHAQVVRLFRATDAWFDFGPRDVWTLFHSYAFDFSVWELWGALLYGGKLVVVPFEVSRTPAAFHALLRREGVTVLNQTPSAFRQLIHHEERTGESEGLSLRYVIFGGEALEFASLRPWYARHAENAPRLVNMYGITETTVHVTYRPLSEVDSREARGSDVGVPIPDLRLYVLDEHMQPVPVGVPGEMYVGGAGLGRGYLGRPELTAQRFVPDPFRSTPGARLYRSGDKARWREDGSLEYLGRLDFQVKIRGFRIELGEIEAALAQHPAVRECIVLAREDGPGGKRLVAWLAAKPGQTLSVPELRDFLKARLPEYMVPSAFVPLEALPLTPNGKIDRKALPDPEAQLAGAEYVAPRTPAEELMAGLWSQLLGVQRVGAEDNFFDLGGHSLLATQLVSRVRDVFGVELPLRDLFEAPTVAALALRVEARTGQGARAPALQPVPRTGTLPLSFAQQRLWFIDQIEPGNPAYNIPSALRLQGKLDARALELSLNAIVQRHEVLRTSFPTEGGRPVQHIAAEQVVPLLVVDLAGTPAESLEVEARRLAEQEALKPFDLARGPLLRATLLRLASDDHVLLLTMHHIVSDGWSMGVLVREMVAAYEAHASGGTLRLPELPVQYADFASWQRGWLQGEVLDAEVAWWRRQLEGAPEALELPTDRPRPAVPTPRGAHVPVRLPEPLSASVEALARAEGATPFMLLLAAFQVLLSRYSGQDDVTVGSPIAGRNRAETEGLLGCFINTLVLRTKLDGAPTFRELLARVRETTLGAYAHQDVPFERLVEQLQPSRDTRRPPLFQVMFTLQNMPVPTQMSGGASGEALRMAAFPVEGRTAQFDLSLTLSRESSGFGGSLEYSVDLFDEATVERMAGHLGTLLEALCAQPDRALSEVSLLTAEERQRVLVEWSGGTADFPGEATLHGLVEAQVDRTPDATALVFEGQSLTYRELDARADSLARHLRTLGVRPETRVAVSVERSLEMVVAVLGVLKAGGGYVPVDPTLPRERRAFLLADCGAPVLLTQRRLASGLPAYDGQVVYLEDVSVTVTSERVAGGAGPRNLAYVIYTSGSTGRPKGVLIEHRSACNLVTQERRVYGTGPGTRMLQMANLGFDISVEEVFTTLASGGTLVLARAESLMPGEPLHRLLAELSINTLSTTPAALAATPSEGLPALTTVITGGEACPASVVTRWAPGRRLLNTYGPTEATVMSSWVECVADGRAPSIGRPLANTTAYVLDAAMQPVPVGVPGELFIGGVGVARGYLNRPELTAERFLLNPFVEDTGARLYRTGDKVRWLANGELEYLGRIDSQVKVRGFRIELGEIESVLRQHTAVADAVVVVREDVPGDKRLVGYVAPKAGQAIDTKDLRGFLQQQLPEYMVPSALVSLDALPLTANGKVDRRALPAPDTSRPADGFVAPRTPTEELLASLWAEVLHVAQVGARDNFFELGGHSLLATQVISRIRDAFKAELPLRDLFEAPHLAALAARIDDAVRAGHGVQAPPLVPVPRTEAMPLSFAQQRLWFIDQLEPGNPAYNLFSALRLEGVLDVTALERAFTELVRRHESLRTTFVATDGQPAQLISAPAPFHVRVVDLGTVPAEAREAEAHRLAEQEVQRPFELSQGPLLRATLLRLADEAHVLLLTMHHIVSDGWSMGVLIREMTALYAAFTSGKPSPLPELPVQYADFTSWQRGWLRGDVLEAQLAWWRGQLADAPAALELPTDRPYPAVPSRRGASVPVSLAGPVAEALEALARREGVTPFMLLLAGFQTLLARYSGQDDISVGSPIAGRNRSETESLIGFFVNTLALRTRVGREQTFRELLAKVRETTLGAYAHQDVPFEKLVEELQLPRDLRRTPLFQVMFTLENVPDASSQATGAGEGKGLSVRGFDAQARSAKFELTLGLTRTAQGYEGVLEYAVDLFEAATVERMVGHLRSLLTAAVARPDTRLAELPLLSDTEREQLLVTWNDTRLPEASERNIPQVIEAQV